MIAENVTDDGCEDPKLLTQGDLAKRLRISIRQVRRLDKSGSLPRPLKIGALKRWDPDEITAWLKRGAPVRSEWEKHNVAVLAPGLALGFGLGTFLATRMDQRAFRRVAMAVIIGGSLVLLVREVARI